MRFLILNGPNLNMLGLREPGLYGEINYAQLVSMVDNACTELGVKANFYQSNHEGCLVDAIQEALGKYNGIVINPGAYTHTSIAILDALKAVNLPAAEVHITDIMQREKFRHRSYAGMACQGHFIGQGIEGYVNAVKFLIDHINNKKAEHDPAHSAQ